MGPRSLPDPIHTVGMGATRSSWPLGGLIVIDFIDKKIVIKTSADLAESQYEVTGVEAAA
jgi:hypothetical protein